MKPGGWSTAKLCGRGTAGLHSYPSSPLNSTRNTKKQKNGETFHLSTTVNARFCQDHKSPGETDWKCSHKLLGLNLTSDQQTRCSSSMPLRCYMPVNRWRCCWKSCWSQMFGLMNMAFHFQYVLSSISHFRKCPNNICLSSVTKPSNSWSYHDGSKGGSQVMLLKSDQVPVGRRSGWIDESTKHHTLTLPNGKSAFVPLTLNTIVQTTYLLS